MRMTVPSPAREDVRGTTVSTFSGSEFLIRSRFSTRRAALVSTTFRKHKVLSFFLSEQKVISDESYTEMRGMNIQPGETERASQRTVKDCSTRGGKVAW